MGKCKNFWLKPTWITLKIYNSEKPHFNILRDSEKLKQVAVSLGKNGVFKKHKTSTPASLVVLKEKSSLL